MLRKTYYPGKNFDDALEGFMVLVKEKNWSFSGVDLAKLEQDSIDQRKERIEHDTLESKYFNLHETFGIGQQERYHRFAAALNAARGAFRNDKSIMAELNRFKRSISRVSVAEPSKDAAIA